MQTHRRTGFVTRVQAIACNLHVVGPCNIVSHDTQVVVEVCLQNTNLIVLSQLTIGQFRKTSKSRTIQSVPSRNVQEVNPGMIGQVRERCTSVLLLCPQDCHLSIVSAHLTTSLLSIKLHITNCKPHLRVEL